MSLPVDKALRKAQSHIKVGELAEAKKLYKQVLAKFPKNKKAIQAYQKLKAGITSKGPLNSETPQEQIDELTRLYDQGQFDEILSKAKPLSGLFPKDELLFSIMGAANAALFRYDAAVECYTESIKIKPNYTDAYYNMGKALQDQGDVDAALEIYDKAIKINPNYADAYNNIGTIFYKKDEFDQAISYISSALKINPNDADAYTNMGNALRDKGDLDAAIDSYEQAIKIKPDYADAYSNMGVALKDQGDLDAAIDSYKQAIKIKPDYAGAYSNMGNALQKKGELDAAIDSCKQAIKIKPDYAEAYSNMGVALNDQGELDEAEASCRQAIALKPDFAEAHSNLGVTLKELGRLDEALASCRQAIALKPDYAEAHSNLGVTLKELDKLEEAIEAYNKALAIKPDYAEAKHNLVETLKIYSPKTNHRNSLIDLDNKIKATHNQHTSPKADQELAIHTSNLLNELQSADKNLNTKYSQIYRRNNVDLNCKRHKEIFKEKEIIPRFCFGCYKVQVDVTTVLDLIRLAALFYESEFESDLTRKCLVEVRPNIPGSYKGLIYCRGIDQAHSVKTQLDVHVRDIDKNLVAKIKKGCSEFPLAFPEYGEVAASEEEMLQYPQAWQALEVEFDIESPIPPKTYVNSSLKEFCLSDYLIIQKWIDYAKGIDDPTSELFCSLPIKYGEIWEIAKARLKQ